MDSTAEGEQNNLKQNSSMNHQMGLKLTLAISKQEILQCNHANLKLSISWNKIQDWWSAWLYQKREG
jgi:hypothetical protein